MTLAATADVWGISGSTFLLAYLVIATAVWLASSRARRALADHPAPGPVGDLAARPHDVACLSGGAELAVYSALSAMHLRGTILSSRGTVRAVGRLGPDADELERAIHLVASAPVQHRRLRFHRTVLRALATPEHRLTAAGLLLPEEQRRRIRRVGGWMLAVAVLGLVRLLAGIAEARSVGLLVMALLAVTMVAAVQLATAPRRTRSGDRTLARLRAEHHALSPAVKPDWALHGPAAAALGIGLFGTSALWASDPDFAGELAAHHVGPGGPGDGGVALADGGDGD
ncbi:TIGR04222 domain-containing membrane protein [Pseudonocardia nigra]|uniref:TIGR04222 domain-containing membrane protein n=1 Tax=Pseudonocardia nigra TaxID=1921578 RepID=UPI001C5EA764|nr:TIGR04222 domain-containing membrane protein [Pseudonocardia nigra]